MSENKKLDEQLNAIIILTVLILSFIVFLALLPYIIKFIAFVGGAITIVGLMIFFAWVLFGKIK